MNLKPDDLPATLRLAGPNPAPGRGPAGAPRRGWTCGSDRHPEGETLRCTRALRHLPGKRLTCLGEWRQRSVLAKLFVDRRHGHRHRQREAAGARLLAAAGIPTPEFLFSGALTDGTPVLLFAALAEPETAGERWRRAAGDPVAEMEIIRPLLNTTSRLIRAGLEHGNPHLDNFIFSGGELYVVDGDAVKQPAAGGALPRSAIVRALARLIAQLPADREDRVLALLPAGIEDAGTTDRAATTGEPLHARLRRELPAVRRQRRLAYVKKCFRTCSEFVRQQTWNRVAIFRRDADGPRLREFLNNPDAVIDRGTMIKEGGSATVVRVEGDDGPWAVKRYNLKNLRHALARGPRPSRAWRSWGSAHRLTISGIATPEAIAVMENRIGPWRRTSYFVSRWVDCSGTAADYRREGGPGHQLVLERLVRMFRVLCRLGIHHGDGKASNFIIRDEEPWLIDLDAMDENCRRATADRGNRTQHSGGR
ncbi:MAG: hypothetical protein JW781_09995 [Deltaproteobacteria bacterium]|nr:hypothetical protein [Candidatus Anaeroferrophillacea bacterium]